MSRAVLESNLDRLRQQLADYAAGNNLPTPDESHAALAKRIAEQIPLSHSTGADVFVEKIVPSGCLLSPQQLPSWSACSTEGQLGTGDSVFLFAAPFGRPDTDCGLLFSRKLEDAESATGIATAHDSGGLLKHMKLPDPTQKPSEFLRSHELPIPDHRELLRESLEWLFSNPWHYVVGQAPAHPSPIAPYGDGNPRAWTHEVRILDCLPLTHCLEAVFLRVGRSNGEQLQRFLDHCDENGVYFVPFNASSIGEAFETMRRLCIAYLRKKLLS